MGNLANLEWLDLEEEPVDRGDTGNLANLIDAGHLANLHAEPVEAGRYRRSWATSHWNPVPDEPSFLLSWADSHLDYHFAQDFLGEFDIFCTSALRVFENQLSGVFQRALIPSSLE